MMQQPITWLEVWTDDAAGGAFIFILRQLQDGTLELVNPHAQNQRVQVFADYHAATAWLNEEEYDLVEGRWSAGI